MDKSAPEYLSLGLIGYPLGHSLSPQLHHAALRAMQLRGEYRLYTIPPLPEGAQALDELLDRLLAGEIHGVNVTIPHKQNVLNRLSSASPAVRAVGAANTLYLHQGGLHGDNTDIPGFLGDLSDLGPFTYPNALVLGAGGAARAAVYALASSGWNVSLAARRRDQAIDLAASLRPSLQPVENCKGSAEIHALLLNIPSLKENMRDNPPGLVVNTTPVGMHPNPDASPWPEGLPFPPGCAVYDMVYNPRETLLLRQARAAGLRTRNGLGMLVEQAALALERWTGLPVPRKAMWQAVQPAPQQEVSHAT